MKYTYLLIDFFTVIVPFLFSFHPRLMFYKTWRAFFPAVLLTGIVFLIWDVYFTYIGVWGFNSKYVIGLKIANLPVEELLFFFCIPYSCVFTYFCLNTFIKVKFSNLAENVITIAIIISSVMFSVLYHQQVYTSFTFSFLALLLIIVKYILKVNWLSGFYVIYLILLIPFMIVNGLLTGTGLNAPVVWYNNHETFGIRILTIPLEDVFYGMDLILLNILFYTSFTHKKTTNKLYGF